MMVAQETSYLGQSMVTTSVVQGRTMLLGIRRHAAEFIDVERTPESTDTFLLENSRSSVLALHGNVAEQEQR